MKAKNFKFFVSINKAITESGKIYIQGVATGTALDADGQRMDKSSVINFLNQINKNSEEGNPLPLKDGHSQDGNIQEEIGAVVFAQLIDDEESSLFIKAELDPDHPSTPYLLKKVNQGKQFAFSIEGFSSEAPRMEFDKTIGDYVTVLKDLIPSAISITSKPAYLPSFFEVVMKAHSLKTNEQEDYNNLTITNSQMPKDIKTEILSEKSEQGTEEVVDQTTETAATETEEKVDSTAEVVEETVEETPETTEEVATEDETTEDATEETVEKSQDIAELITKAMKGEFTTIAEAINKLEAVAKSLHDDVEAIKDMPLQKKSKAVMKSTDFTERTFPAGEANFAENYKKIVS